MTWKLVIKNTLPGLNEYISALNINKFRGAKLKKDTEQYISTFIRSQLKGVKIRVPVHITYKHYEPTRKRDKSNVASFCAKTAEDALVKCGVLRDDGWACVEGFSHEFYIDKQNPRIVILILEVGNGSPFHNT
jgi:Holliday junction resolvase RusA-like endonuclease